MLPGGHTYIPFDLTSPPFFSAEESLSELVLRGSIIYNAIFVILRIVPRRQSGNLGISDILLITLIADACQNGMAGEYKSIAGGIVLVTTIVLWDLIFDALSFRFSWFRKLAEPPPVLLVENGTLKRRNMRRELITWQELEVQLREQGVESIEKVKAAYLESDGRISVLPME